MVIIIRKRFIITVTCFLACFSAIFFTGYRKHIPTFAFGLKEDVNVIIDAGHGGEDGGAVSSDGTTEAALNLEIAWRTHDLFWFCGQKTMMIRETEAAVCDDGLTSIRERKVSDIHNRVDLVNNTDHAVLISIHQNSLPSSPVTHGAQVFWNTVEGAEPLALSIQKSLNQTINTDKEKAAKSIAPTIYLMKHAACPAVLVECGFLSNAAEAKYLQDPIHQRKLALSITAGYLLAGEDVP